MLDISKRIEKAEWINDNLAAIVNKYSSLEDEAIHQKAKREAAEVFKKADKIFGK